MNLRLLSLALTLSLLTACASLPETPPTRSEVVGSYYMGDGLGYAVYLALHDDGRYAGSSSGCLGTFGET